MAITTGVPSLLTSRTSLNVSNGLFFSDPSYFMASKPKGNFRNSPNHFVIYFRGFANMAFDLVVPPRSLKIAIIN